MNIKHYCPICVFAAALIAVNASADIYLNSQGEETPNGRPLSFWIGRIDDLTQGKIRDDEGRWFDYDELKTFRLRCQPLILWELEKRLKREAYGGLGAMCDGSGTTNARYLSKCDLGADKDKFISLLIKLARHSPIYTHSGDEIKEIIFGIDMPDLRHQADLIPLLTESKYYCMLAERGYVSALPWLEKSLKKPQQLTVTVTAVGDLWEMATPALPRLLTLLAASKHTPIRLCLIEAILKIDPANQTAQAALDRLPEDAGSYKTLLECLATPKNPECLSLFLRNSKPDSPDFKRSLSMVVRRWGVDSIPLIVKSLKSDSIEEQRLWHAAMPHLVKFKERSAPLLAERVESSASKFELYWMIDFCNATGADADPIIAKLLHKSKTDAAACQAIDKLKAAPESRAVAKFICGDGNLNQHNKFAVLSLMNFELAAKDDFLLRRIADLFDGAASRQDCNRLILRKCSDIPAIDQLLIPKVKELFSAPITPTLRLEYLSWHLKRTKDIATARACFKDIFTKNNHEILSHSTSCAEPAGAFLVEYSRITGSSDKAVELAQETESDWIAFSKEGGITAGTGPVVFTLRNSLEFLAALEFSISKENMGKVFNATLARATAIITQQIEIKPDAFPQAFPKVSKQYLPIIKSLSNSIDDKQAWSLIFLVSINIETDDWPGEFTSLFFNKVSLSMQSRQMFDRIFATKALKTMKGMAHQAKAAELLISLLQDPDDKVVEASTDALSAKGTSILPVIVKHIDNKDPFIATTMCQLIEGMSTYGSNALPVLEKVVEAEHGDWTVKAAALKAMGKVSPLSKTARFIAERELKNDNKAIQGAAVESLIMMGNYKSRDLITKELQQTALKCFPGSSRCLQNLSDEGID